METLYTVKRFASKKAIKEALANGTPVQLKSVSVFSSGVPNGRHTLCGPTEYERKFYGEITVSNGCLITIK
jgi:hypothetical protein